MTQLIDEGKAYYCFDTPDELAALRLAAEKEKRNNIYPRPEVFPTAADVEKARAEGRPVTMRLAITQTEPIVIEDEVRGTISIDPAELSDFIIQKSDGFPTYHMAVVVDDELMGVTHIVRGQEHLMNTPNHQMIQKALGFRIPKYAHMSVTVSDSGGKLSKRERPKSLRMALKAMQDLDTELLARIGGISVEDVELFLKNKSVPDMPVIDKIAEAMGVHLPEINLVDFFRSGYIPEAMVNFLALLGWNPGDDREIMSRQELIEAFDLSRISKSNSLFDRKKLQSFNTEHIKTAPSEKMVEYFRAYLEEVKSPVAKADDEKLAYLIKINDGARTLEQIEEKTRFAYLSDEEMVYDPKAVKKVLLKGDGLAMLKVVGQALAAMEELTAEGIENLLRGLAEEKQVGLGKIAQPLRVAICGNTVSPPIFDAVDMLGMATTLKRIEQTLSQFSQET
ncbi:MAG: glutamate--tRNA ligase family protein [Planctomycetota bacterium]